MAGQLTIDTLKASSGVLATQNGMTGIAKAWVNFNGTGTVAIRDSFNVSSITDNGTGDYTVNFTTALSSASYSACYSGARPSYTASDITLCISAAPTTSALRIVTMNGSGTAIDLLIVSVSIFSA